MRIFVGISLSTKTKESLFNLQRVWLETAFRKSPVAFNNFHLTLKFVGEVTEREVEDLYYCLKDKLTDTQTFNIKIGDIGFFVKNERHLIWAGITEGKPQLQKLNKLINEAVEIVGISTTKQKFVPHITLARNVMFRDRGNNLPLISEVEIVDKITIFRSHYVGGNLTYTPIYEVNLNN